MNYDQKSPTSCPNLLFNNKIVANIENAGKFQAMPGFWSTEILKEFVTKKLI